MSSTLTDCSKFDIVGTIISSPRKNTLWRCSVECCECLYKFAPGVGIWLKMETQGYGNWHLKTWKCQISGGLPPPPILGQTIDRCIKLILSCITLTVFLGHHTSLGKMLAITHVNEVQMQKLTWQYLNPLNESALV